MNKGLTTQEQIALAKEILQVKNRRERSLKLGEILDRENYHQMICTNCITHY